MNAHARAAGRVLRAAVLAIGLVSAGCHSYVPVEVATVDPQDEVRIFVTESAAARLSSDLGVYSRSIDGRFRQEEHDSVSIAVPVTRVYRGRTVDSGYQTLFLGKGEVVRVDRRELSRGRTIAVGIGAVALFALLVDNVVQWMDPNPSTEEEPPPPPAPSRGRSRVVVIPAA